MKSKDKKVSLEEQFNDYESTPVPEEARQTWFQQGMVWLGSGFGLSGLATGGLLADGLSFRDMLLASVIGSIIVFILGTLIALVSSHLHLSTSYTSRLSFGCGGAKILGVILCIFNFGWFAFQADLFGNTVSSIIRQVWGMDTPTVLFTILGGLAMSLTAIFGFKAIKLLSEVGLPLIGLMCIVAVGKTLTIVSGSEIVTSGPVGKPITIAMGISIIVGSYAAGIAIIGDFSRFSKSTKDCVIGASLGYIWGYIPILMCGAFFTYAFKNWNIVEVMIESLGLGFFGAVVLIIGQWTTNDNNLYTSVLGLTNTLDGIIKIPRMRLSLIIGVISTAIAAIGMYKYFENFLSLLGVFIIPVAGIMMADYYICGREKYKSENPEPISGINLSAIISWIIASFVGMTMTATPVGLGWFVQVGDVFPVSIICMAIAMIFYTLFENAKKHKTVD